jgi:hypothetical protein
MPRLLTWTCDSGLCRTQYTPSNGWLAVLFVGSAVQFAPFEEDLHGDDQFGLFRVCSQKCAHAVLDGWLSGATCRR